MKLQPYNVRYTTEFRLNVKGLDLLRIVKNCLRSIRNRICRCPPPPTGLEGPALAQYVASFPCDQNAVDVFKGEWTTRLPVAGVNAGAVPLYEDGRLTWGLQLLGGAQGLRVLELGPLEGGHTILLEQKGAAEITAIESNRRAYLRCLITKEIMGLKHARFLLGDFLAYLRSSPPRFDLAVASGVFYHQRNPAELIALLAQVADRLYLGTHYYDPQIIGRKEYLKRKFPIHEESVHAGFRHTQHRYEYQEGLQVAGYCGGSAPFSHWLSRDDILGCLRHFGFTQIHTGCEEPEHGNGPSFAVAAMK